MGAKIVTEKHYSVYDENDVLQEATTDKDHAEKTRKALDDQAAAYAEALEDAARMQEQWASEEAEIREQQLADAREAKKARATAKKG